MKFNLFKKEKKRNLTNEQLIEKLWQLWTKDKLCSPALELLTVISNLGASGHAEFIKLCKENEYFNNCLTVSFNLLPQIIQDNYKTAQKIYEATPENERDEDFLDEYDDFFYDNENLVDNLLLSIAKQLNVEEM